MGTGRAVQTSIYFMGASGKGDAYFVGSTFEAAASLFTSSMTVVREKAADKFFGLYAEVLTLFQREDATYVSNHIYETLNNSTD